MFRGFFGNKVMDKALEKKLNSSIKSIFLSTNTKDYGDWDFRAYDSLNSLIDENKCIITSKVENFIASPIFVSDIPTASIFGYTNKSKIFLLIVKFLSYIFGSKRSGLKETKLNFSEIEKHGALPLLIKYPMPKTGNPLPIKMKSCSFTNRYLRHIYFLYIFKSKLGSFFKKKKFLTLDIGSSYGCFQSLLKKEFSFSKHILVDIPGQLILAEYYLNTEFPNARIAGLSVTSKMKEIHENFIDEYDFILIAAPEYDKLKIDKIDLVTNFISFSEMERKWFDEYISSNPFKKADFFYTANRYDSYPTYSSDITISDFPLQNYKKIYSRTLPILKYYFRSRFLFFTKKFRYSSEILHFIGQRK